MQSQKTQKSILSFFQKPIINVSDDDVIKAIETPPEKPPRPVLSGQKPSVFNSIKHKFAKLDNSRPQANVTSNGNSQATEPPTQKNYFSANTPRIPDNGTSSVRSLATDQPKPNNYFGASRTNIPASGGSTIHPLPTDQPYPKNYFGANGTSTIHSLATNQPNPKNYFGANRTNIPANGPSTIHPLATDQPNPTNYFSPSRTNIPANGTSTIYPSATDQLNQKNYFGANRTMNPANGTSSMHSLAATQPSQKNIFGANRTVIPENGKTCPIFIDDDDALGPDTPGMRPLVPRLKRVIEDGINLSDAFDLSAPSSKRSKFLQVPNVMMKSNDEDSDTLSKFEWLHPSRIKDAKGRKPGDPLYNKKTLYIPPDALRKMSASQRQYWDIKSQYMDVMLFFKVGKFYELYELDAEIGHRELDWKITLSGVGKCRQVGVSENGIEDAVQKLIARGHKVGRVEQLESSQQAKSRGATSVIKRKLVQVLTPATTTEGNMGPDSVHLLAIKEDGVSTNGSTVFGFAFVDCAALKFWVGSITDDASCATLGALLMQVSPKEIIYESRGLSKEAQKALRKYNLSGLTPSELSPSDAFEEASEIRNIIESKGYFMGSCNLWHHAIDGIFHRDLALCALGGLTGHLSRLMLNDVIRNGDILCYEVYRGCLRMDGQTLVNLEIFSNNADGGSSGTLYNYMNNCVTSSGKRLLRSWICHPLQDVKKINDRLAVVDELIANSEMKLRVAQSLRKLPDLERLLGRVKSSIQSSSLLALPLIGSKVIKQRLKVFGSLIRGMRVGMEMLMTVQEHEVMAALLSNVVSIPVLTGGDGLAKFLAQFEAAIDSDFPNYQNHEVTETEAETLSILMELFIEKAIQWSQVIQAINCIDVLRSFAISATSSNGAMCRPLVLPQFKKSTNLSTDPTCPILQMKGLWHPYALGESGGQPVPNDIHLGGGEENGQVPCTLLLTGPNMGGKSTLLRATCLAVILAQLGCYVPCEACSLSVVDTIFTRLGSTDRIMTGESTFLIECTETASVLQTATQNSLVLLDELGRGTSTFDGYAIAYAVFRHLVETVNCRLLFATHYHPLTKEFGSHPRVKLQHMACSFESTSNSSSVAEKKIVFLYRLASGACPESYGMEVARLAGIPDSVVDAASKAGKVMKVKVGESFKSSEQRENFSTLHEEWFNGVLSVANTTEMEMDEDAVDDMFCLWHELRNSFKTVRF